MKGVTNRIRALGGSTPKTNKRKKVKPPCLWRRQYTVIQSLRASGGAPVDSVGCERLADQGKDYEWQCLVAAMLSSQTRDQANAEAMASLRSHGNSIDRIAATSERRLEKLIAKVGFHRVKAKHLRVAARICKHRHDGCVPRTLEELLAIPGVGPKMAHLTLHAAFGRQQGICVDTHVHRIANALGWVSTKTPEHTRKALEQWLPKAHWPHINVLLVGLGQLQQQKPRDLMERCLNLPNGQQLDALRLVKRIGLKLQLGKHLALDMAAKRSKAVRQLLDE